MQHNDDLPLVCQKNVANMSEQTCYHLLKILNRKGVLNIIGLETVKTGHTYFGHSIRTKIFIISGMQMGIWSTFGAMAL